MQKPLLNKMSQCLINEAKIALNARRESEILLKFADLVSVSIRAFGSSHRYDYWVRRTLSPVGSYW